jgi:hypothetical protein
MILLLDASSACSEDFSIYGVLEYAPNDEIIRERLSAILFDISQLKLLECVDSIILLNLDNYDLKLKSITNFKKVLSLYKETWLITEKSRRLLRTLKIYNQQDLGLGPTRLSKETLIEKEFFDIWSQSLKALLKNKEVIILGEWISQHSVLLAEHSPNIKLFKRNFFYFDNKALNGFYEVTEDREKYINYYKSFYINRVTDNNNFDYSEYQSNTYCLLVDPFKNIILTSNYYGEYFIFKSDYGGSSAEVNKIIFIGNNNLYIERFLKRINIGKKNYYWYDCSENNFKIKPEMDGLIFKSVHKLTQSKLTELISEISVGEYKNKTVFLLSENSISIPLNSKFILVEVPKIEDYKMSLQILFFSMIFDKLYRSQEACDLSEFLSIELHRSGKLDKFFNSLTSLPEIDKLLNDLLMNPKIKIELLNLDFWYDFINYYETKLSLSENTEKKSNDTALENRAEQKPEKWIEFKLDLKSDLWMIENNMHVLVNKVKYSNSKGLGIMNYLVDECRYPKTISAKELIRIINKRFTKKTKKALYANPVQSIIAIVRYDVNKIGFNNLRLINQFQLREECSYYPEVGYDIKFTRENDSKENKK